MNKRVALVLGSGGSRGMAHIGAIEELERRGYQITSIAGCSIGSLIGGIYASGKLPEAHDWFCQLDIQQILSLTDVSLGLSHVVKGEKVLQAIQEFVPDRNIEDLPIPSAFVATDLLNAQEVIFRQGSLFEAIRASISIPMFFRPVRYQDTLLIDGGLVNPLPLNIVQRHENDLLVAINISAQDHMSVKIGRNISLPSVPKHLQRFSNLAHRWDNLASKVEHKINTKTEDSISAQLNYFSLINRSIDIQIQRNSQLMTQFYHPDILVEIPQNEYSTFDFDKASEILERGRLAMAESLDRFESQH